jgi:uncharacterized MnhB-related membrane protein
LLIFAESLPELGGPETVMIVLLMLSSLAGWISIFVALLSYGPGTAIGGAAVGASLLTILVATGVLHRTRQRVGTSQPDLAA